MRAVTTTNLSKHKAQSAQTTIRESFRLVRKQPERSACVQSSQRSPIKKTKRLIRSLAQVEECLVVWGTYAHLDAVVDHRQQRRHRQRHSKERAVTKLDRELVVLQPQASCQKDLLKIKTFRRRLIDPRMMSEDLALNHKQRREDCL